ncbi:MAG: NAD-binding protein, partial [Pseudomonadota bacterium]
KLIHQTLVAGHAVAVAEAIGLCLETGADVEQFYKIVTEGTGFAYSRYFENRVPRMRDGEFSALFMLQFLLKDIRLAKDMADAPETNFPMLTTLVETFEAAMACGLEADDFSAVAKLVADRVGKPIERS